MSASALSSTHKRALPAHVHAPVAWFVLVALRSPCDILLDQRHSQESLFPRAHSLRCNCKHVGRSVCASAPCRHRRLTPHPNWSHHRSPRAGSVIIAKRRNRAFPVACLVIAPQARPSACGSRFQEVRSVPPVSRRITCFRCEHMGGHRVPAWAYLGWGVPHLFRIRRGPLRRLSPMQPRVSASRCGLSRLRRLLWTTNSMSGRPPVTPNKIMWLRCVFFSS